MIVDLQTLFVERLQVSFREVTVLKQVWQGPPETAIELENLPCLYFLIGPQTNGPVPTDDDTPGAIEIARDFVGRLLIRPASGGEDIRDYGSEANAVALPLFAIMQNHLVSHPRLHTATLPELGLAQNLQFADSGLVQRPGPGGAPYFAIDWTLNIVGRIFIEDEGYA